MPRTKKVVDPNSTKPTPVRKRPVKARPVSPPVEQLPLQTVVDAPIQKKSHRFSLHAIKALVDNLASSVVLVSAVMFLGMAGGYVWNRSKDDSRPVDPVVINDSSPESAARQYAEQYLAGLATVFGEAAKQTHSWKDLGKAQEFVTPKKDAVEAQAFKQMGEHLESINGKNWNPEKAQLVFEGFAKGLGKK